jgi:septal ring factor EnvC (AmiA/AmiB activator)
MHRRPADPGAAERAIIPAAGKARFPSVGGGFETGRVGLKLPPGQNAGQATTEAVAIAGREKKRVRLGLPALAVLVLGAAQALVARAADDDPEAALNALRGRIATVQAELEAQAGRRDAAQSELRGLEKSVAQGAAALAATRDELDAGRERRRALIAQKGATEQRLAGQRDVLGRQIRAAYLGGRQERLRLALNQQDPARLGRMLVYYRYLSDARADQIESVTAELARLAEIETSLAVENRRLQALSERRSRELEALESSRDERKKLVAGIESRLSSSGAELNRLRAEEAGLQTLIEELRRALDQLPGATREPFAEQRGRLNWPTKGRLLNDYGQPRAGGSLKWNGVLVGTDRGAEVRSVYHGRVAYADWLPGLGLLIIVEHGDGYMSLYGHNEALFRQVGDWVEPGETIATAGDSGGRSRAALYFEIRKGEDPVNPHRWFRTRLSAR